MSIHEIDAKVSELRELRNLESEIKAAITAIEDDLKAEMVKRGTDVVTGRDCVVSWKTVISSRFDSAAFKLSHADLFRQYSRAITSRRLVIA